MKSSSKNPDNVSQDVLMVIYLCKGESSERLLYALVPMPIRSEQRISSAVLLESLTAWLWSSGTCYLSAIMQGSMARLAFFTNEASWSPASRRMLPLVKKAKNEVKAECDILVSAIGARSNVTAGLQSLSGKSSSFLTK